MKTIILILFISCKLFATDWYVDNAASGNNDGTSWTDAWGSFSAISWGSINPGDIIYISGGSVSKTYTETLVIGASGTSGNRIIVKNGEDAGHTGTVIIDGEYIRDGIYIGDYDYLTIDGFTITDITGGDYGIYLYRSDYVTLQNLTITNFRGRGIEIDGYDPNYCVGVKVLDSYIESEDAIFEMLTDCLYAQYTENFEVARCTLILNFNGSLVYHTDALQVGPTEGITDIHDNWIETAGASESGNDNNTFIMGYLNGTIRVWNNVILGSESDQMWHAMQIRGSDAGYSCRIEFYNNYVEARGSISAGAKINNSNADIVVKNNIFVSIGSSEWDGAALQFDVDVDTVANIDYNIYYKSNGTSRINYNGSIRTWNDWVNIYGYDANGYNVEPSLDSLYAPDAADDPTIDVGTTILFFSDDRAQVSRPQGSAWDIGAFEYIEAEATGSTKMILKK